MDMDYFAQEESYHFSLWSFSYRDKPIVRNIVVSPVNSRQPTKKRRPVDREQARLSGSIGVTEALGIVFHSTLQRGRNVRRLGMRGSHQRIPGSTNKNCGTYDEDKLCPSKDTETVRNIDTRKES